MSYQVIGYPICPYVQRILIAMNFKNIDYTLTYLNPHEEIPSWFEQYSPLRKIPVIKMPTGDVLFESVVILEYLEEMYPKINLHPLSIIERAKNRAWVEVISLLYVHQHNAVTAKNIDDCQEHLNRLDNNLAVIEENLDSQKPFFNSDTFGMADVIFAPFFARHTILTRKSGEDSLAPYPKLVRIKGNIMACPFVQKTTTPEWEVQLIDSYRERLSFLFS